MARKSDIELDHFRAGAPAGIRHRDGYGKRIPPPCRFQGPIGKRRVAQTEAERKGRGLPVCVEQRIAVQRAIGDFIRILVEMGQIIRLHRHGEGKLSGRIDRAQQKARERPAPLHAAIERLQDGLDLMAPVFRDDRRAADHNDNHIGIDAGRRLNESFLIGRKRQACAITAGAEGRAAVRHGVRSIRRGLAEGDIPGLTRNIFPLMVRRIAHHKDHHIRLRGRPAGRVEIAFIPGHEARRVPQRLAQTGQGRHHIRRANTARAMVARVFEIREAAQDRHLAHAFRVEGEKPVILQQYR